MTRFPVQIVRREEVDGTWSSRVTCSDHPTCDPGWVDPTEHEDGSDPHPDRSSARALQHAEEQADDHVSDDHPELDHLFATSDSARWARYRG